MTGVDLQSATFGVTRTLYQYGRGMDRMDIPLTLDCFEPDAHLFYSTLYEGDPQGFVDWLWPIHEKMLVLNHSIHNVLVEPAGEGWVSEGYVSTALRIALAEDQAADLISRGRYLDTWRETDGRLRITARTYVSDQVTSIPVVVPDLTEHLPRRPDLTRVPSLRSSQDVSYAHLFGGS